VDLVIAALASVGTLTGVLVLTDGSETVHERVGHEVGSLLAGIPDRSARRRPDIVSRVRLDLGTGLMAANALKNVEPSHCWLRSVKKDLQGDETCDRPPCAACNTDAHNRSRDFDAREGGEEFRAVHSWESDSIAYRARFRLLELRHEGLAKTPFL
jgi:hypothetical protein